MKINLKSNPTLTSVQAVEVKDPSFLKLTFSDGTTITLQDYHEEDCCELVYVAWEEADKRFFDQLKDKPLQSIELVPTEGIGITLKFDTVELIPTIWEPYSYGTTIGAYNYQNGYYSDELEIKVFLKDTFMGTIDLADCMEDQIV